MAVGACMARGARVASGGIHGKEVGACMAGGHASQGACMTGGSAWQERRPLQRTVRILLECILVLGGC